MLRFLFGGGPGGEDREETREEATLRQVNAGGTRFDRLVLTRNRRVMVSVADRGRTLRLQESFVDAPSEVLGAVGTLFSARSASARSRARSEIRDYLLRATPPASAQTPTKPRAPSRPRPSDAPHVERLRLEFDWINEEYFGGRLPSVPLRLSGRMRRRNGHFSPDPLEIAISRALCEHGAAGEAERTLRHEMIHLWQWVEGRKPGHGSDFRRWARRLDIPPRATRHVLWAEGTR